MQHNGRGLDDTEHPFTEDVFMNGMFSSIINNDYRGNGISLVSNCFQKKQRFRE